MKCTQCGCEDFIDAKELYASVNTFCGDGGAVQDISEVSLMNRHVVKEQETNPFNGRVRYFEREEFVNNGVIRAYVCKKCGHIEFFCETYINEEKAQKEKKEAEKKRLEAIEEAKKEIESNDSRIEELTKLADDENITVRQLKLYEEEIEKLRAKNKLLKGKIKGNLF